MLTVKLLTDAFSALLGVLEAGALNSEQRKRLEVVRALVEGRTPQACAHENAVYEDDDVLVCQDCRARLN